MIKPFENPIYVTRPFLPPLSKFCSGLEEVWRNKWLTNDGPVKDRFEEALSKLFRTKNVCLFNNGTQALEIAIKGMNISGEAVTTPFTFAATAHALYRNQVRPVFCDIEPQYYTIDPEKIEILITPQTTAILAVHVYGFPCQLNRLKQIAAKYNLKLIYDAAHAFGVRVAGKQIAHYGDASMFSFHATKLFHTFEGGMLIFNDEKLKKPFNYLKNFGFNYDGEVVMPGTNAKISELQALMGLLMLDYFDDIIAKRKMLVEKYRELLTGINGIHIYPELPADVIYNYAYMPIEVYDDDFGMSSDRLSEELNKYNVFPRRYFHPLINEFNCYKSMPQPNSLDVAKGVSRRILALPLYSDLEIGDVCKIADLIRLIGNYIS